jgi:small subunit ribosomal protein S4
MFNTKEKKERSLGTKLFLKPHRCTGPKCVTVRAPHAPGSHGKSRRRAPSEVGTQLREKQKIKATYGLREQAMRRVFEDASRNPGVTSQMILTILERRLDNIVYRLGFAPSRSVARQLVSHGHITVNGRRVDIPSYQVKMGDLIAIRKESKDHHVLKNLAERIKKYEAPVWLTLDKKKIEGKMSAMPKDVEMSFDVPLVVDYYSK